jgi:dTDP-4-amino-4,6-dideoxygalactose transaminase
VSAASIIKESVKKIPLMMPYVTSAAVDSVMNTLRTRWIGQGPRVEEFERIFSGLMLGRESVAVGSCTDALHLAYLLAGIGRGDEVVSPVFTCTATNIPLLWIGAKIRFADVEKDSLNVDPVSIRALSTDRTKAIIVVHYGGSPCRMDGIWDAGAPIIEDCAQALGASYHGIPIGAIGHFACFSFQAVKHITTGDGGMLVLGSELADKARRMRWFGIDRKAKLNGTWANDIVEVGYKYQMTDISAAMGLAGLQSLDGQIIYRRHLMDAYASGLANIPGIRIINRDPHGAAWLCTVLAEERENLRRKLSEKGIESDPVHYRNDRYAVFAKFRRPGEFPNMDALEKKYLCLPLHMRMDSADVHYICDVIRNGW